MNEPEIPLTYGVPVAFNEPGHGKIYQNAGRIVPRGQDRPINEASIQALEKQGFTRGLIEALLRDTENFAHRFWIIDNSGSMAMPDGLRLAETAKNHAIKFVKCTRWQEMQQTIEAQCVLAAQLEIPTNFCLLNDPGRQVGPQRFGIAENRADYSDLAVAQSTMRNAGPHGVTPFTQHLKAIKTEIAAMEPELRRDGTKVVVVIATDGLPSDESSYSTPGIQKEFVETLRSLERYPVWVVIRLFTDEDDIVDYYNDLDSQLELSLEVLDDLAGEAKEMYTHNKWLNYGLPLHRMREMGFSNRLFDMLDEQKLSKYDLRDFFRILFGASKMDGVPDPESDWNGFLKAMEPVVEKENMQANPITRKLEPWVNMKQLRRDYGKGFFRR